MTPELFYWARFIAIAVAVIVAVVWLNKQP